MLSRKMWVSSNLVFAIERLNCENVPRMKRIEQLLFAHTQFPSFLPVQIFARELRE